MTTKHGKAKKARNSLHGVPMRPLGECGKIVGGGTPSKGKPEYWNGHIPWITAKEMWTDEIHDSKLKISDAGLAASPAKLIPANSVLFVVRGSILFKRIPVAISRVVCTINQDMKAIVPCDDLLPDYLALMMRASNEELKSRVGTAGNSAGKLDTAEWTSIEIPIPTMDEQRRLVKRIGAMTIQIDQARQTRQATIDEAATVFKRALEIDFSEKSSKNWVDYTADELFKIVGGQVSPLDPEFSKLPYLGPEHVESGTGRIVGKRLSVGKLKMKSGKYRFSPQHVVYSKIRPALRKVCTPDYSGLCSADMYALKPNLDLITRDFLKFLLLAPSFSYYANEKSDRNAMPKINQAALRGFRFRIPEHPEQVRITNLLTSILAKHAELRCLQIETEAELAAFTPALLAKAFRGEL
ncbi:restriction endonuclease subunit S [Haloferula sp.]|uniref:restriction endonuclease subunit S n=1 Tax=Haloferula sp. TaxID=2497595 RepID=UPI003C72B4BE